MSDSGEISGLEAVLASGRQRFLSFAQRCGAGADAEDVLQDCWLRIRSVDAPVASPEAYIFRVIYNVVRDRRRGERRSADRARAWDEVMSEREADPLAVPAPERALLARESIAAAEERLTALGEPTFSIFVRHRLRGEVQTAIARDLGMGLSTVEKHLRRAYHALLTSGSARDDG